MESPAILPPPPYGLHPDFLQRHRRRMWLSVLGAVACCAIGVLVFQSRDPGQSESARQRDAILYVVIGLGLFVFAWRSLRYVQFGNAVGISGREALFRVVDVRTHKTKFRSVLWHDYVLEPWSPSGQPERTVQVAFPDKVRPLYLMGDHVLALVVDGLPKHPLILYRNLWPLELRAEEIRTIASRLQQVDREAGWHVVETDKGPRLLSSRDIDQRSRASAERRRAQRG